MKLPKQVFCKVVPGDRGDEAWLSAAASLDGAMGDDIEATDIGVYQLVEVTRVARPIQTVQKTRKR